jgi:hypothetical protein
MIPMLKAGGKRSFKKNSNGAVRRVTTLNLGRLKMPLHYQHTVRTTWTLTQPR